MKPSTCVEQIIQEIQTVRSRLQDCLPTLGSMDAHNVEHLITSLYKQEQQLTIGSPDELIRQSEDTNDWKVFVEQNHDKPEVITEVASTRPRKDEAQLVADNVRSARENAAVEAYVMNLLPTLRENRTPLEKVKLYTYVKHVLQKQYVPTNLQDRIASKLVDHLLTF